MDHGEPGGGTPMVKHLSGEAGQSDDGVRSDSA
ncbi:hypothetical protein SAMN06265347_1234 [Halobellus salinus]|nr:hypothetical protein SAMN06265347_1234 [Halobellus salinus]